ncbi:hypothetical protein ACEQPO_30020 [Bacillus sp. SL00103]
MTKDLFHWNELVMSLFGFFLIFLLSHDILSREIHLKTIRFLVNHPFEHYYR